MSHEGWGSDAFLAEDDDAFFVVGAADASSLGEQGGVYRQFGKRLLDIGIAVISLPFVLPLILLSAAIIALDGSNPFYAQERVGYHNRTFKMWKLRSMVPNAKEALETYLERDPAAKAEWETDQKLTNDPRVTRFGKVIRKFSVDELPQIWNVLTGDMSIVGPRPIMPEQLRLYAGASYCRLRPGITGLWQVSGRNENTFAARSD